jgi:hypothetical protein
MSNRFEITVADDVRTDKIWVELRMDGKLVLEVHPEGPATLLTICCEGIWLDTNMSDFIVALNACMERAKQVAEPSRQKSADSECID